MKRTRKGFILLLSLWLLFSNLPLALFSQAIHAESTEEEDYLVFLDFENSESLNIQNTTNSSGKLTVDEYYLGNQSLKYIVHESGDPTIDSGSLLVETLEDIDGTEYGYLNFWIKDTQGDNGIKVSLQDADNQETDFGDVWIDGAVKDQWVPLSIPLSNFSEIDLTQIQGIRFGEWNSGTYYIDEVQFSNINLSDLQVEASVDSGRYTESQHVELSNGANSTIYYTTDGSDPDITSTIYESPIEVTEDMIIKAVGFQDRLNGVISTFSYQIDNFTIENHEATWFQTFDYGGDVFDISEVGVTAEIVDNDERDLQVLEYNVLESDSPEVDDGSVEIKSDYPIDVSNLNYLVFYIKDTNGTNNMKLSLIDSNGRETDFGAGGWRDGLDTIHNQWTQYFVPINDLEGVDEIDLTEITGVRMGQWNAGTYFIDSIYFDNYLYTGEPSLVPDVPQANQVDGYQFSESMELILANRSGSQIYYTLDGSNPTVDSELYTESITLNGTTTVKAVSSAHNQLSEELIVEYIQNDSMLSDVIADQTSGKYTESFEVNLSSVDEAVIYYTIDGTDPTESSLVADGPIAITETTELRAVAINDKGEQSNLTLFEYQFPSEPEQPTFSVEETIHSGSFDVEIIGSQAGDIYYTLDGSEPTTNSSLYNYPIHINGTTRLKAIVVLDGLVSEVGEIYYQIIPDGVNVDKPGGTYLESVVVELRGGGEIFFTKDGTEPTENGYEPTESAQAYSDPFQLTEDTTLKVITRYHNSRYFSEVETHEYVIQQASLLEEPRISPEAGMYGDRQQVEIESANDEAVIYYTTDGTEPTTQSEIFNAPFLVTEDTEVRAIAVTNDEISPVASNQYQITNVESPFLRVDGNVMRDNYGAGKVVQLKGTNIGGWLVMEEWQSPTNAPDQKTMLETLSNRFGEDRTWELVNQFQDNWFTENDFDRLKEEGVNLLRLPITHFEMANEDGSLKDSGRERLEWFLEEAEKREIYTLIDLHGAFGSQNGNDHSGDISNPGIGDFFGNEENIQKTIRLWQDIAELAKDNPWVAGYDLLNEPGGAVGTEQFETYDRLYRAIREIDSDHIIHIQAIWDPIHLPHPSFYNWENVVYQYHFYGWEDINNLEYQKDFVDSKVTMVNETTSHDVPVFVGEFTFFENEESWEYGLETFDREGWSYTGWTYKVSGENSSWGMYTAPRTNNEVADIYNDSFETIFEKWSATTETDFTRNDKIADVQSKHFKLDAISDTEPPVIEGQDAVVEVGTSETVESIIQLYIRDNHDGVIYPSRSQTMSVTYDMSLPNVNISAFDSNIVGDNVVTITATDSSENVAEEVFTITVVESDSETDEDIEEEKSALEDLIKELEELDFDKYTEESKKQLIEALENAKAILSNPNATLAELQEAIHQLIEAQSQLTSIEEDSDDLDVDEESEDDEDSEEEGEKLPQTSEQFTIIIGVLGLILILFGGWMIVSKKFKIFED